MSQSPSPVNVSGSVSDANRDQTTLQHLFGTSRQTDALFCLQEDEAALRSDTLLENTIHARLSGNDAELHILTDFRETVSIISYPDESPAIVPDEVRFDDKTKPQSNLSIATSQEDESVPIPISHSSRGFGSDVITKKTQVALHNQLSHQAQVAEYSNRNRSLIDREISEQGHVASSVRDDRNVVHGTSSIGSTTHLMRNSVDALSRLVTNEPAPNTRDMTEPSWALSDTPSRSEHDIENEGEEGGEEVFTIPEAFLVRETIDIPFADIVDTVDSVDHATMSSIKRRFCILTLLIVAFVAIVLGSVLYVTLVRNNAKPTVEGGFFEPSYLSLNSVSDDIEKNVLQRNMTFDGMNALNPRKMALDWITKTDHLQLDVSDSHLRQRYVLALLVFESSMSNDVGWLSFTNECEWLGVTCKNGNVIKLEIGDKKLAGTIPPEIARLEYLEILDLSSNSLSGTIPPELGNIVNLIEIRLQSNEELSGSIPPELGNLQFMTIIDLGYNNFTGTLPTELGNANALKEIIMTRNKISGPIPKEISKLSDLEVIHLEHNEMSGTIPLELGALTRITQLKFGTNSLVGSIPSEIGQLKGLTQLLIYENSLNGTLPSEIGNLVQLTNLSLDRNKLTGSLPSDIGNLHNLTELFAYTNQFTGTLPPEIGSLRNLQQLSVGRNSLKGTLPSELGNLKDLHHLGLDSNHFTGTLPTELQELRSLTRLRLNGNQFTGPYLNGLGTSSANMTVLCVGSGNNFTGDLPMEHDEDGLNCW